MGYYEFTISLADESRDALMQRLAGQDCLGFIENEKNIIAYFRDGSGVNDIVKLLEESGTVLRDAGLDNDLSFNYSFISERDWNETWKKKFKPIDAGERFSILPPWEGLKENRINLIIDPGMAFGTGHHETTRTCLMLIERLSGNCRKGSFLDVGTGTGILAIAASRLGFGRIIGVDTDPLAVDAAQRNAGLNDLETIAILEGTAAPELGTFDFIAANLMSGILIRIAPELAPCLAEGGVALLSGMLVGQEEEVIAAMERQGLKFREKHIDGRWVSVVMTR